MALDFRMSQAHMHQAALDVFLNNANAAAAAADAFAETLEETDAGDAEPAQPIPARLFGIRDWNEPDWSKKRKEVSEDAGPPVAKAARKLANQAPKAPTAAVPRRAKQEPASSELPSWLRDQGLEVSRSPETATAVQLPGMMSGQQQQWATPEQASAMLQQQLAKEAQLQAQVLLLQQQLQVGQLKAKQEAEEENAQQNAGGSSSSSRQAAESQTPPWLRGKTESTDVSGSHGKDMKGKGKSKGKGKTKGKHGKDKAPSDAAEDKPRRKRGGQKSGYWSGWWAAEMATRAGDPTAMQRFKDQNDKPYTVRKGPAQMPKGYRQQ